MAGQPAEGDLEGVRFAAGPPVSVVLLPQNWLVSCDFVDGPACRHGSEATLRVRASGVDGRQVRFVIERQDGGGWKHYASPVAPIKEGVAEARVPMTHPSLPEDGKPLQPAQLRVHCELV